MTNHNHANDADERMYADKKRYYELHPEKKRGVIDKRHSQ